MNKCGTVRNLLSEGNRNSCFCFSITSFEMSKEKAAPQQKRTRKYTCSTYSCDTASLRPTHQCSVITQTVLAVQSKTYALFRAPYSRMGEWPAQPELRLRWSIISLPYNPLQADFQAVSLLWEANKVCQAWCDSEGNDEYSRVKKMNIFRPACHRPTSSSEYSYQEQSKGIFCRLDT